MRTLIGVIGGAIVFAMLMEIFISYLLPRRVKRDPRIARLALAGAWRPWRWLGRRLGGASGDTWLGFFGPAGLLMNLALSVAGLMFGYACLQWSGGSRLAPTAHGINFGDDFYFSAATLVSSGTERLSSHSTYADTVQVMTAATGLAVLTIVIGYLPSLAQAFSRRETTVSQLDSRAGSPPTAGRLVLRTIQRGGWPRVNDYLGEWETWAAD